MEKRASRWEGKTIELSSQLETLLILSTLQISGPSLIFAAILLQEQQQQQRLQLPAVSVGGGSFEEIATSAGWPEREPASELV